jgi:hypothetical protein
VAVKCAGCDNQENSLEKKLEIEITFPFWVAYLGNLQLARWSPLQMFAWAVFPLAGLVLCYLWFTHHHVLAFSDVLLLLMCFFLTPVLVLLTLYLHRRRNPLAVGPFQYRFDEEGIHASSAAFSMSVKWPAIQKVRATGSFLFFFIAAGRAQAMPVDQLRAAGILDELRELARQKVKNTAL